MRGEGKEVKNGRVPGFCRRARRDYESKAKSQWLMAKSWFQMVGAIGLKHEILREYQTADEGLSELGGQRLSASPPAPRHKS
jgi:hypothetical protein